MFHKNNTRQWGLMRCELMTRVGSLSSDLIWVICLFCLDNCLQRSLNWSCSTELQSDECNQWTIIRQKQLLSFAVTVVWSSVCTPARKYEGMHKYKYLLSICAGLTSDLFIFCWDLQIKNRIWISLHRKTIRHFGVTIADLGCTTKAEKTEKKKHLYRIWLFRALLIVLGHVHCALNRIMFQVCAHL